MGESVTVKKMPLAFRMITGTVLDSTTRSETRIHSSGGGGYLVHGTGQVDAAKITSTVETKQDIWLRADDGAETPFRLNIDVPLMPAQRVSLVYAYLDGFDEKELLLLYNHNARRGWMLPVSDKWAKIRIDPGRWGMFGIGLAAIVIGIFASSGLIGVAGAAMIVYWIASSGRPIKKSRARIEEHVAQIRQSLEAGTQPDQVTLPVLPPG